MTIMTVLYPAVTQYWFTVQYRYAKRNFNISNFLQTRCEPL